MFKKITFGVIGLIGLGVFLISSSAHAASAAPAERFDLGTRVMLGQTLNILQSVLDQVGARVNNPVRPIENPVAVSQVLGGIKSILITVDTELSNMPSPVAQGNPSPVNIPSGSLEVSGASVTSNAQPATISWFLSPKILFVLLPLAILLVVALSFRKKKETIPESQMPIQAEPEREIKTA